MDWPIFHAIRGDKSGFCLQVAMDVACDTFPCCQICVSHSDSPQIFYLHSANARYGQNFYPLELQASHILVFRQTVFLLPRLGSQRL